MLFKKKFRGVEDEKEEVSSYWMTLRKWVRTMKRKTRKQCVQISFWKTLSPFRKTNHNCKKLGQKIRSHGLYFRRVKNLHCLWIQQDNSTALKQYNEEWVVLISVEHKEPAISAYTLERSFNSRSSGFPLTERILYSINSLEFTVHYIHVKSALTT